MNWVALAGAMLVSYTFQSALGGAVQMCWLAGIKAASLPGELGIPELFEKLKGCCLESQGEKLLQWRR